MSSTRHLLTVFVCLLLPPSAFACAQAKKDRLNVVVFLVDDLGWADLSCQGSTFYETPNVDRLAATGVRFTDGYASCPVCSPTRASLLTGQYPTRIGITDWIPGSSGKRGGAVVTPQDDHHLPLEHITLAEALKAHDYVTFFAGKWHLNAAGQDGFFPEDQGFDVNKGGHHKGSPPGGYYAPYANPRLESGPDGEYLTDRLTDETIAFIEANRDKPFLTYLSFYTVHTPIQPCKRYAEKFAAKAAVLPPLERDHISEKYNAKTRPRQDNVGLATMVHAMDDNVGRVLDALDELKLTGNTIVVFTSDNGGLSTKGNVGPGCNKPLRAGKGWCYEGGIRVPLIIRAPGMASGATCDEPAISMDVYPTILDLLGLPALPKQHCDGVSLASALEDPSTHIDREAIFWHYPHYHGSNWRPGAAVRAGDYKLIEFYETDDVEVYNLAEDLGETNDLSRQMPKKTAELLKTLRAFQKDTGAKMPRRIE
jgi:arylsulfatase A-like enzyme